MSYDSLGNRIGYTTTGFLATVGGVNTYFNGTTAYSYDGRNELTSETTNRYLQHEHDQRLPVRRRHVNRHVHRGGQRHRDQERVLHAMTPKAKQVASGGTGNTYGYYGNGNPTLGKAQR